MFPLEFDQLAAAYVWFGDYEQESQDKTQDILSELVKYSMLVYRPILGENLSGVWHRYYLNDLARIFASARHANGASDPYLRFGQHFVHTLATAQHLYSQGHESVSDGIYLFEAERFNIREGQAWATVHMREDEKIARICSDFGTSGPFILDVRLNSER